MAIMKEIVAVSKSRMSLLKRIVCILLWVICIVIVLLAGGGSGREKTELKEKVAFKTKSEIEILDDGFKWSKYGKKMVKNSPNPRYTN